MPDTKTLKKYLNKTTAWPWTSIYTHPFGVQIKEVTITNFTGADYFKQHDAILILMLRSMLPEMINLIEAADQLIEGSTTRADILENGEIHVHWTKVSQEHWSNLYNTLKAIKEKKN